MRARCDHDSNVGFLLLGGGSGNRNPASWLQAKCAATITNPPKTLRTPDAQLALHYSQKPLLYLRAIRRDYGAGYGNRIRFRSLEDFGTPYIPIPQNGSGGVNRKPILSDTNRVRRRLRHARMKWIWNAESNCGCRVTSAVLCQLSYSRINLGTG